MTSEEKLLLAKCEDLFSLCDRYASARFTQFLNETEQALIKNNIGNPVGYNVCFFGGYTGAQRTIFGVFNEWEEAWEDKFPIKVLKIRKKYKKELTHRDYLGTVLSKGIDRSKVGDIIIDEDNAYIFIAEDIAEYICHSIDKISNVGVSVKVEEVHKIQTPEPKFEIIDTVVASLRLDACIASLLNKPRKISAELICDGRVSINHLPITRISYILNPGDVISVRGFGRFVYEEQGSNTRSGKLHIKIKKFI